jgi:hypothetical protein
VIRATDGGFIDLGGSYTTADIGNVQVDSTSVLLYSGNLDNSGQTLSFGPTGTYCLGSVPLSGTSITITGGTIDLTGATVQFGDTTLDGVNVIGGDLTVHSANTLTITNSAISSGRIDAGDYARIEFTDVAEVDNLAITANGLDLLIDGDGSSPSITFGRNASLSGSLYYSQIFHSERNNPNFENDGTITANGGTSIIDDYGTGFTVTNTGRLSAINGAILYVGYQTSDPYLGQPQGTFVNTGTIEALSGASIIVGIPLNNSGTIVLNNATFSISTLAVGTGSLAGSGTIVGDLVLSSDPSTLSFSIGGKMQGADYDSLLVDGNVTLGGLLQVDLANGFEPDAVDTFVLLEQSPGYEFDGQFLDVPDGGRLETLDGLGSFLVNYGTGQYSNEIVLSDFEPGTLPEPASAAAGVSLAGILLTRRRQKAGGRGANQSS